MNPVRHVLRLLKDPFALSWRRHARIRALATQPAVDPLHPIFDAAFYLRQLRSARPADHGSARTNPLAHYLATGWREGLSPHPFFDIRWYLADNPDVARADIEPLGHYLAHGWKEDRRPHPAFDGSRYLAHHPALLLSATCPLIAFARAPHALPPVDERPSPAATWSSHYPHSRPYPYLEPQVMADRAAAYRAARRTGNSIALCTCITGGYDTLRMPEHLSPDVDYFLFTDRPETDGYGVFQVLPLQIQMEDRARASRHVKLQPHHCLARYDIIVWCDANVIVRGDLSDRLRLFRESDLPLAFVPHPLRRCLYHEAVICALSGKDRTEIIVAQMLAHQREGYPFDHGLIEANFFACRPQRPEARAFFDGWWAQFTQGSRRDQLGANYVLWKQGLAWFPLLGEGHNTRTHPATALLDHGTHDSDRYAGLASRHRPRRNIESSSKSAEDLSNSPVVRQPS
ncbi:MAG: hypothetical protein JF599_08310 [Verrucomicrobia bacterium]|nr:hypothetical protein [Verrucomicrobiota bacterium]